jgi:hypothetical protein
MWTIELNITRLGGGHVTELQVVSSDGLCSCERSCYRKNIYSGLRSVIRSCSRETPPLAVTLTITPIINYTNSDGELGC